MSKKGSLKNKCRFCYEHLGSGQFCDEECEQDFYDYNNIIISERWVSRTLLLIECPARETEVKLFAKRHSMSLRLLKRKLKDKFDIKRCD